MKSRVLFICVQNSARSQMAEAWLKELCGEFFEAESAGTDPGVIHPLTVEVMQEVGVDLSRKDTRSVFDAWRSGRLYAHVIRVCDRAIEKSCPIFPGAREPENWSLPDPASIAGSYEERIDRFREVRDQIRERVQGWCDKFCTGATNSVDEEASSNQMLI